MGTSLFDAANVTTNRALRSEDERLYEIEQALMKEMGTATLTGQIKRTARIILNKWKANEPSLAQALMQTWHDKGEGVLLRYPGQPLEERKKELTKKYLDELSKEEREKARKSLLNPEDTSYRVEREEHIDNLRVGWMERMRVSERNESKYWDVNDQQE